MEGMPSQSGRPSWASLKARALFQEQLKGFIVGSNRNKFAVRRRGQRGPRWVWALLFGRYHRIQKEVFVSQTRAMAVGCREVSRGESY